MAIPHARSQRACPWKVVVGRGDGGGEKMCWQTREVAVSSHQPATCPFRAGCVTLCKDFERLVRKARACVKCGTAPHQSYELLCNV